MLSSYLGYLTEEFISYMQWVGGKPLDELIEYEFLFLSTIAHFTKWFCFCWNWDEAKALCKVLGALPLGKKTAP